MSRFRLVWCPKLSNKREFPSSGTIKERFDSIIAFQKACGFDIVKRGKWQNVSDEELIRMAKELSPDKPLTQRDMDDHAGDGLFPSYPTITDRFGSIAAFQRRCGYEVAERAPAASWQDVSNCELVRIANELSPGEPLKVKAVYDLNKERKFPEIKFIYKRFGSLAGLNRARGFEVAERVPAVDWSSFSNDDVIRLAIESSPSKSLTKRDIDERSKQRLLPSSHAIAMRFGSISNFTELVELKRAEMAAKTIGDHL